MVILHFPATDELVGPFSDCLSSQRWLKETDRAGEPHETRLLSDPVETMFEERT